MSVSNARLNTNADFMKDLNTYIQHIVAKEEVPNTSENVQEVNVDVESEAKAKYVINVNNSEIILLENHCSKTSSALVAKVSGCMKVSL